jgi:HK97 family phage prohead protease
METRSNQQVIRTDKPRTIAGYAATFGPAALIRDVRGNAFNEVIHPDAFTRSLVEQPDIRFLRDHNPQSILGRTKSGTLRVGVDNVGLWYECELPDTSEARDLVESIRRGDVDSCSFGFTTVEDEWTPGDIPTRQLRDLTLYECSIVAFPAYENGTTVDLRSMQLGVAAPIGRTRLMRAKIRLRNA